MNPLDQQYQKALIFIIVVILAASGYWVLRHFRPSLFLGEPDLIVPIENRDLSEPDDPEKSSTPAPEPEIVVHIAGAVVSPGVYRLPVDARVHQAIEKAGGAKADADVHRLNLAAKIHDGQQIYVPLIPKTPEKTVDARSRSVPPPQSVTNMPPSTYSSLINLNTATSEQLQTLPHIGSVTARRIIEHRDTYGPFSTVEDLTHVRGIGQKTLERIRHLVVVY